MWRRGRLPGRDVLRGGVEVGRSIRIMLERGLVDPLRPHEGLRALQAARRSGPFAATALRAARREPHVPALAGEHGEMLTYGELESSANALARGLREFGIRPGDITGVLCRDHPGMVLALIAAGRLGARTVLLNTGFAKPQLMDAIRREGIVSMLLDDEFLELTDPMPRVLAGGSRAGTGASIPTVEDLMGGRSTAPLPLPTEPGGIVLMTSGTTGAPKGAARRRISPLQSAQLLDRIPYARGGATVIAAPLFHGTGLGHLAIAMALGKKAVLKGSRFDPEETLAAVAEHRADSLVLVPTMLRRIVELGQGPLRDHDTSSLRIVACGGSSLSPDLSRRATEAFGEVLYNVYGSTEVANVAVATPEELRKAPGTVGRAPVGCRVALYDEARRPISAADRTGAIFAGNGLSFSGYTDGGQKEIVDGMVYTGDVGHFDRDGLLFVDGRDDEMIVSGAENVYPLEVEHLLAGRADIRDAAAIGVGDPHFGERLRVYLVPQPGATPDAEEIKDYVRAHLARHKVPRDVVFVDEIPRNPAGKVARALLEGDRPLAGGDRTP